MKDLAALVMSVMRRHTARPRYLVGVAVLATFLMSMAVFGAINYGVESLPMILAGTLIEWPGQIAVLFCLRAITRGNSYAHQKDSIECNRAASAYAPPT